MKKFIQLLPVLFFLFGSLISTAQEAKETGFEGDNFSLEGALQFFKDSKSPEDFEKQLNTENNDVNNLDLNKDGEIDYISVVDHHKDEVHALVLQVHLSEDDIQDIAVIEIEKTSKENAIAQIIGDDTVYGSEQIVEPYEMVASQSKESGPSASIELRPIMINVWAWPSVRFVYAPTYRVYISPWGWRSHPRWYKTWRPSPWHIFKPRGHHYHRHFRVTRTHRVVHAHSIYKPKKRHSKVVVTRTNNTRMTHRATRNNGRTIKTNKVTRTTTNNNGKKTTIKKKNVTVKSKNGKVVGKKKVTKKKVTKANGNKKVTKTTKKVRKKRRR